MDTTGIIAVACLIIAFLCFVVYGVHEVYQRLKRRLSHYSPEQDIAYMVCSVCFCYLNGTEHTCPACDRQLFHAVASRPRPSLPQQPTKSGKSLRKRR